jgi:serine/threonine-protein kinase RsbW
MGAIEIMQTSSGEARWIEISSDLDFGMHALEGLVCELQWAGFDCRQIKVIELAFTEALVNAVHHGNQDDPSKLILIEYSIDVRGLQLAIEDEGEGFDFADVEDPTVPTNIHRPGGRGLLLIRSLMEGVEFNKRGNRIVMRAPRKPFENGQKAAA